MTQVQSSEVDGHPFRPKRMTTRYGGLLSSSRCTTKPSGSMFSWIGVTCIVMVCAGCIKKVQGLAAQASQTPRAQAQSPLQDNSSNSVYRYFGYGSNMCLETMTSLRGLSPLAYSPAVLDDYELVFDVPGVPLVEPCWASVQAAAKGQKQQVHGILYDLTPEEFAKVCQTEGVPVAYQLQRLKVQTYKPHQYQYDNDQTNNNNKDDVVQYVNAFTLVTSILIKKSTSQRQSQPQPSQSYLNVLIRGAQENGIDPAYIKQLQAIKPGKTLFGSGTAEASLTASRFREEIQTRFGSRQQGI
jgi:hypothetical protein